MCFEFVCVSVFYNYESILYESLYECLDGRLVFYCHINLVTKAINVL